jgi:uncharacterized protein YjbI with pentapeptide repeats
MSTKRQLIDRWKTEPGLEIRQRIIDYLMDLEPGHGKTAQAILEMLDGLPYRDDVPGGKDLRGADVAHGREMNFSEWDFSFGDVGPFDFCDLSYCRFDCASAEQTGFHNILNHTSFRDVRFQNCYFMNSQVQHCCFDNAKLEGCNFEDADLTGSTFVKANCKRATFFGANLTGCDLRESILEEAVFESVLIDENTDIRGASLVNAYYDDRYDAAGNIFGKGTDFRIAKLDRTTRFGADPAALTYELLDAVFRILNVDTRPQASRIKSLLTDAKGRLPKESWDDLLNQIFSKLSKDERELFDHTLDDAYRALL